MSPGRAVDVPTLLQQQQGTVGRAVNHPARPRNDSHSLFEPVGSQSQRALVLVSPQLETGGKPEDEEQTLRH